MPSSKAARARRILVVRSQGGLEGTSFDHLCNGLLTRAAVAPAPLAPSHLVWIEMHHSTVQTAFVWRGEEAFPWKRVLDVAGPDAEVFADESVGDADFEAGSKTYPRLRRWVWT